jgi:hypothetical protein
MHQHHRPDPTLGNPAQGAAQRLKLLLAFEQLRRRNL